MINSHEFGAISSHRGKLVGIDQVRAFDIGRNNLIVTRLFL